jgi:hypothetical protein
MSSQPVRQMGQKDRERGFDLNVLTPETECLAVMQTINWLVRGLSLYFCFHEREGLD